MCDNDNTKSLRASVFGEQALELFQRAVNPGPGEACSNGTVRSRVYYHTQDVGLLVTAFRAAVSHMHAQAVALEKAGEDPARVFKRTRNPHYFPQGATLATAVLGTRGARALRACGS